MNVPPDFLEILPKIDDEILYALIDVVLDIETELTVSGRKNVQIEEIRLAIRYDLLLPTDSVGQRRRYWDLRRKALQLLDRFHFIIFLEYEETGSATWEGCYSLSVSDSPSFQDCVAALRAEEDRRNPSQRTETDVNSAVARLLQLSESFHRVVLRLRERRSERPPLTVADEYDVQYLFCALLETRFQDVRPEEWMPSYAGGASRVDFLLKKESVLFETKMTRDGLTDRKLGEELIIDITRYKQRDIKALVCFVYDPGHRLKNPSAIENDLSKPTDGLDVRVLVRPK